MKKNIWKTKTSYTFLIYSEKLYHEKNPYLLQLVIIFSYSSVYKQIKMTPSFRPVFLLPYCKNKTVREFSDYFGRVLFK